MKSMSVCTTKGTFVCSVVMSTTRSVELGQHSWKTLICEEVCSRSSLIFCPPRPMIAPAWDWCTRTRTSSSPAFFCS